MILRGVTFGELSSESSVKRQQQIYFPLFYSLLLLITQQQHSIVIIILSKYLKICKRKKGVKVPLIFPQVSVHLTFTQHKNHSHKCALWQLSQRIKVPKNEAKKNFMSRESKHFHRCCCCCWWFTSPLTRLKTKITCLISSVAYSTVLEVHLEYAHNSHHMLEFHFHKIASQPRYDKRPKREHRKLSCRKVLYEVIYTKKKHHIENNKKRRRKSEAVASNRIVLILKKQRERKES